MRRLRSAASPSLGVVAPPEGASQVSFLGDVLDELPPVWERDMNDEQLAAIRHEEGPLANFAGAGSGKTRAVVHRVVRLVKHLGVDPRRIFCVTFSRAGKLEMDARIRKLGCDGVEVQTWHAFCGRVLREEGTREGRWTVDEHEKAKTFVKQALGYKHLNWVGSDLKKIRSFIGICKANLWEASSEEALREAEKVFGRRNAGLAVKAFSISQDLVESAGLLTFDDMLVYVARLFAEDDGVRATWAAKFDYVIQDEGQDANLAQVTLARMLSREHRNYMIVGDPGQNIFTFRGADSAYLSGFPEEWGAKVVTMARNYRSADAIVRIANEVIRPGKHKLPEDMRAMRGVEGEARVVAASTLEDEGSELVAFVKEKMAAGVSPSDICVLYRLHAQSRAVEEAFLREKIPYVLVGGTNFYERTECKALLGYLRVALGRDRDGEALKRCINAPFRFLGSAFVEKVAEEASRDDQGFGPIDWVRRASQRDRIQSRQAASANDWCEMVLSVGRKARGEERLPTAIGGNEEIGDSDPKPWGPFDVLNYVVTKTRFIEWLEKEEGEESIENSHAANVRELLRVAQSFSDVPSFLDFVDEQVREAGKNKRRQASRAVTMMTIHKSKGLEWPIVWVVGCNENVLPHAKGDIEEERRLAYVAFTRARDVLVASHVEEMALRTGLRPVDRSRFLDAFLKKAEESEESNPDGIKCGGFEPATNVVEFPSADEPIVVVPPEEGVLERLAEKAASLGYGERSSLAWLTEGAAQSSLPVVRTCADCGRAFEECACGEPMSVR